MRLGAVLFGEMEGDSRHSLISFNKVKVDESVSMEQSAIDGNDEIVVDEMAIQQFKTVGDWSRRSSFRSDVDRALLTSPRAVEKIKRQWEKTPYDFDIYLVNDPRVNMSDYREVGMVSMDFVRDELKLTPEEIPDNDPDKITVIYVGNSGAERFMASGWILAHRLGHALVRGDNSVSHLWREYTDGLRSKVKNLLFNVYGIRMNPGRYGEYGGDWKDVQKQDLMLRYVAQQLGTMKSARDGKMRNWFEFGYELLAQYMLTGHVKFNKLPDSIVTGLLGYGRKDSRYARNKDELARYNETGLVAYEEQIESELNGILGAAVGSVFVM